MKRPLIVGHRGAPRYCPENTLVSFQKALELGVDGIELDVQFSADKEIVVLHDETIDRTTEDESGFVSSYTLSQLKRMDFGGKFDRRFAGVRMPTLEEVLELIKSYTNNCVNDIHLDIELKTGLVQYDGLEEKVVKLIERYDYTNLQMSSFYHQSLLNVKKANPDVATGVLYMSGLFEPWKYGQRLNAQYINPNYSALNPDFFDISHSEDAGNGRSYDRERELCQDKEFKYMPWTVDSERFIRMMFKQQVDGIITNRPDAALAIRNEMANE